MAHTARTAGSLDSLTHMASGICSWAGQFVARVRAAPRLAFEGGFVGLSQVLILILYAAGFRAITEWYPPDVLGEGTLLAGALALVGAIVLQPVFAAHVRLFPEYRERGLVSWFHRHIDAYTLALSSIASIAGAVAIAASNVGGGQNDAALAVLVALALIGQTRFTLRSDVLGALRQQVRLAVYRLLRIGVYPLASVALAAWSGPTLLMFMAGTALSFWVPALLMHAFGWGRIREVDTGSGASEPALRGEILQYGIPLIALGAANWFSMVGDRYVLAYYLPSADVGVYAAIYGLFSQPYLALAGGLVIWLRPILFDAAASGGTAAARRILRLWILGGGALAVGGGVLLWFTRRFWLRVFLAEPYHRDGAFLGCILLAYSLHVVATALTYRLMVSKKTLPQLVSVVVAAVLNLVLNMILIPGWGLDGAGLATALSFLVQVVLLAMYCRQLDVDARSVDAQTIRVSG